MKSLLDCSEETIKNKNQEIFESKRRIYELTTATTPKAKDVSSFYLEVTNVTSNNNTAFLKELDTNNGEQINLESSRKSKKNIFKKIVIEELNEAKKSYDINNHNSMIYITHLEIERTILTNYIKKYNEFYSNDIIEELEKYKDELFKEEFIEVDFEQFLHN